MRGLLGCSIIVASALAAGAAGADDVTALETQLGEEHAALATEDCTLACRALASIRRAGERICALEPGPRCEAARAKVEDARRRVSDACPDCALAAAPPTDDKDEERRAAQAPQPVEAQTTGVSESAPRRGGCASCSTLGARQPGAPSGDLGLLVVAAWAATRIRKKRC